MGRVEPLFGPRGLAIASTLCACLWLAGLPAQAQDSGPKFLAQAVSPQNGYYGACGADMPIGVTIQANLHAPMSLSVTLTYRYVSVDPVIAPSPMMRAHMPLFASETYAAAIIISDEAPAYLKGSDGSLEYWIDARDPSGNLASGEPGSVVIRHCPIPNSVAARASAPQGGR